MNSMTGFGMAEYKNDDIYLRVSIKSLNDKYLNIKTKFPYEFPEYLSYKIEKYIPDFVNRGGIFVIVSIKDKRNDISTLEISDPKFEKIFFKLHEIKEKFGIEVKLALADLVNQQKTDSSPIDPYYLSDKFDELLFSTLNKAIDNLIDERKNEGNDLEEFFIKAINKIEVSLNTVELSIPEYLEELKINVKNIFKDIADDEKINLSKFNEEKLLSEINYYIDKSDITEELVRLKSHLNKFREIISVTNQPIGLSMIFIIQEMQREIATISAKYHNVSIFSEVITIKEEIEKCKEQALNVE